MANQNTDISNYITLSRKFFEHPFWDEDREFSKAEAWLDLVRSARYDVSEGTMLIGMTVTKWNRCEFVASIRFLMKRWKWSTGKVTRFLNLLKSEKMITTRVENGQTIIHIINYNLYNHMPNTEHQKPRPQSVSSESRNTNDTPSIQERNGSDTGTERERNETNNVNKENKEKKEKKCSKKSFAAPSVEDVIEYFKENGYNESHARKAFKYYNDADWVDSRNNKVFNWKQKVQSVWFKDDGKLQDEKPVRYNQNEDLERQRQAYLMRQQQNKLNQAIA
jgi:hypothetical protein